MQRPTSLTRRPRPPRGGKAVAAAGLSRERILQATAALVAEDGLAALSTRKLGHRLGCEAMAIYHHYPNKHHLLDALVDQAIASLQWPAPELPALQQLREAMWAFRAMAHRHAALFPLIATHRLNTPTGIAFIERILALVQAVEPEPEAAARAFRVIGYYLVGAALDETAGYARGPSAAMPVSDAFVARHAPRLNAAGRWFAAEQWETTFELGAEALLDALFTRRPRRRKQAA